MTGDACQVWASNPSIVSFNGKPFGRVRLEGCKINPSGEYARYSMDRFELPVAAHHGEFFCFKKDENKWTISIKS